MGTPYIDHGGEMKFLNKTLGYKASIKLKKRGWTGYDAYKGEGKICNPKSKVVYKIKGKWNASMLAIDAQNNKEILIWKMSTKPGGDPKQFHFGEFTK